MLRGGVESAGRGRDFDAVVSLEVNFGGEPEGLAVFAHIGDTPGRYAQVACVVQVDDVFVVPPTDEEGGSATVEGEREVLPEKCLGADRGGVDGLLGLRRGQWTKGRALIELVETAAVQRDGGGDVLRVWRKTEGRREQGRGGRRKAKNEMGVSGRFQRPISNLGTCARLSLYPKTRTFLAPLNLQRVNARLSQQVQVMACIQIGHRKKEPHSVLTRQLVRFSTRI